ncbi:MAG: phosphoribosyltransferase regulatory subunit [Candidatus Petromonas sp.]|jgi:ATP phosphoribosyltransferase regulatory subunit|nr:phosphoribosyltransferase regulatory subunit [Candidatus Petromonas sp.]
MVFYKDLFPEGVEDLHSEEYEFKEEIINCIKKIFKSFGYRQIVTPSFEYYDLYSGIEGTLSKDKMFKLIDNNGRILVLRPDATIPVARMAATNYKSCKDYLKFSYVTNIFRLNNTQQGDKREFIQAGIEHLGNDKPDCDAEVIAVGIKSLLECGFQDFHIDLGQIKFLNSLIEETKLNKFEKIKLHNLIENKNYGDLKEFLAKADISPRLQDIFNKVPKLYGKPEKVLMKARSLVINDEMGKALDNLEHVYNILKDYGYGKYIIFDLGFTEEMNYYTGVIFKGYVNNFGEVVLSGGRYDDLTKQFGAQKPACGFGLNIDKLIEVMSMYDVKKEIDCYTDYLVLYRENAREKAIKICQDLRERGFIVESDSYNGDASFYIKNSTFRNIKEIIEVNGENVKSTNVLKNQINRYNIKQFYKVLDNKEILVSIH